MHTVPAVPLHAYDRHRLAFREILEDPIVAERPLAELARLTACAAAESEADRERVGQIESAVVAVRKLLDARQESISREDVVVAAFFALDLLGAHHDLDAAVLHALHQMLWVSLPGLTGEERRPARRLPRPCLRRMREGRDMG